jgi:hypothetical protein
MGADVSIDTVVALVALIISITTLVTSFYFWRRTFRPIVTATVKTVSAGNRAIVYDLVLLNSGSIPARNVRLSAVEAGLHEALGADATPENKKRWLACFSENMVIPLLQNGDKTSCPFGTTQAKNQGFWRYKAAIPILISYDGWFGKEYRESQDIFIVDSSSFTDGSWSAPSSAQTQL